MRIVLSASLALLIGQSSTLAAAGPQQPNHPAITENLQAQFPPLPGINVRRGRGNFDDDLDDCFRENDLDNQRDCLEDLRDDYDRGRNRNRDRDDFEDDLEDCRDEDDWDDRRDCLEDLRDDYDRDSRRNPRRLGGPPYLNRDR